jgi:hypothetical protein
LAYGWETGSIAGIDRLQFGDGKIKTTVSLRAVDGRKCLLHIVLDGTAAAPYALTTAFRLPVRFKQAVGLVAQARYRDRADQGWQPAAERPP